MLEVSTLLWTNGPSRRPRPQPPTEQVTFRPLATSLTDTISPIQLEGTITIFLTKNPFLCSPTPSIACPLRVDKKLERCPFKVLCKSPASCSHNFAANFSPQPTTAASRFGQFTQFRVDLSSLTCIWPTKATLTTRGNPFTLECISQLTKVLSVIQASRLNCTLHFLCVLKVSEVPRRSLNLHFLNSPESQTKDKFFSNRSPLTTYPKYNWCEYILRWFSTMAFCTLSTSILAMFQFFFIQPAREARGPEGPARWERFTWA